MIAGLIAGIRTLEIIINHYINRLNIFLEKPDGSVRLAGSTLDYMGRVEVKHNGQWGTVCGFQWGRQDAEGLESKKVKESSF